jgi:GNAT superfamily N-acetyltransferase
MIFESIKSLILEEQERQGGRFIENINIDMYMEKISSKAEIISHTIGGRCKGFIAFYCNDINTKKAYITVLIVDPRDKGLGRALMKYVLSVAKLRGFIACQAEIKKKNLTSYNMCIKLGFRPVEDRGEKDLLEVLL